MAHPSFFDTIEPIALRDELSAFLGATDDGVVAFSYLDVVKAAGHSCPTVAGDPRQKEIMQKMLQGTAAPEDVAAFRSMWQRRVEAIFAAADGVIEVVRVSD